MSKYISMPCHMNRIISFTFVRPVYQYLETKLLYEEKSNAFSNLTINSTITSVQEIVNIFFGLSHIFYHNFSRESLFRRAIAKGLPKFFKNKKVFFFLFQANADILCSRVLARSRLSNEREWKRISVIRRSPSVRAVENVRIIALSPPHDTNLIATFVMSK